MNFHQTPEEIIKNASPKDRILWNSIFLQYGDRIALSQLYFCGNPAGGEFMNYFNNKLYFALKFRAGSNGNASITTAKIDFYNDVDAVQLTIAKNSAVWDTTAANIKFTANYIDIESQIFSRLVMTNYAFINFIGYRLNF
jgi:hypothetical protein